MRDNDDNDADGDDNLRMTTDIVTSFVSNNKLTPDQLTELIRSVHKTVGSLADGEEPVSVERPKPAAPVNRSIHNDYIICLEDGKRLKMLKRYLRSTYNLSPEEYRKRWGLPAD